MDELSPYAAPSAVLDTGEASGPLRPGGRGERFGAVIVDGIIQLVCFLAVALPIAFATGWWRNYLEIVTGGGSQAIWLGLGMSLAGFLLFVLIQAQPLSSAGQTWGKRLLKLRIVDMDGRKPEFARLVGLRYAVGWLISAIPVAGLIFSLADALFIFRSDRRCIHDLIAGTRVVVAD